MNKARHNCGLAIWRGDEYILIFINFTQQWFGLKITEYQQGKNTLIVKRHFL
jgi:hypothetical protein